MALRKVWEGMMSRCYRENHKSYKNYGGRGITVCKRWHTFKNFEKDMSPRPAGTQLDRRDNNRSYSKHNCRWATLEQQRANRRTAINEALIDGTPRAQIAASMGVTSSTLAKRYKRNGSIERVNKPAEFEGVHLQEWAQVLGVNYETLRCRLRKRGTIWL